jgi:hypothetical protein
VNIHKHEKDIISLNNRLALGYEDMLSFNYGYLKALLENKLINTKEYNVLIKVYASVDNANCIYYIGKDGRLKRYV